MDSTNITSTSAHSAPSDSSAMVKLSELIEGINPPPPIRLPKDGPNSDAQTPIQSTPPDTRNSKTSSLRTVQYFEQLTEDVLAQSGISSSMSLPTDYVNRINRVVQVIKQSQASQAQLLEHREPTIKNKTQALHFFDNCILEYSIMLANLLIEGKGYNVEIDMEPSGPIKSDRVVYAANKEKSFPIVAVDGVLCGGGSARSIENLHLDISRLRSFNLGPRNMDDAGEKASEDHRDTSAEFIQSFDSDLSSVGLQLPSNKPHELADSTKEDFQILEQAWDQLASRDLTFGILTDYNKSLILLRHRHSGTLYVSPQINLSSQEINAITFTACLTKLSLWDATARQQQLSASSPTTLPVDEINPSPTSFFDEIKWIEQGKTGKLSGKVVRVEVPNVIHMVFRTNWILYSSYPSVLNRHPVSLKIDANCYGSKKSSSRKQSDAPINQEETEDSPPLSAKSEESMATKASSPPLMALKYLATGAQMDSSSQKMGVAWAGYYEDGDHVVEIVAKLDLVNRLVGEALVYERLQQKKGGGVPTCLGMYRTEEFPKNGVLVMSNNGRSVVHDKGISAAERDMLVKILEDIHDCGVLHNNLTEKHILRNNRAMLSIAGFHYADVYDVNDKFRSLASLEMQRFRALLDELVQPAGPTS